MILLSVSGVVVFYIITCVLFWVLHLENRMPRWLTLITLPGVLTAVLIVEVIYDRRTDI